ncbi:unnamed protein product [Oikopleura dioica]|uniref:Programmed cell death protein 5 n=1 Tax=Oikopleura dioica TaxID=34765 RepID=E4XSS2_OIKDI|nr:unnamed protein product [Oikopleura dioica]
MSNDAALDELRRQRMSQLQGGQQQQQQRQQMEEMTNSMLGQILDQSARARLNNVALVNPQKAKQTEAMLMQMARSGKIQSKLNESSLGDILNQIASTQKKTTVKFERRRVMDSDDSESD